MEVAAEGGELIIEEGQLAGMRISVPENAFSTKQTITVSAVDVPQGLAAGQANVLGSMIAVESEGEFSDSLIEISIPIALPSGHFAMPFWYEQKSGQFEGLTVTNLTDSSVSCLTGRLRPGRNDGLAKRAGLRSIGNMLVLSIAESALFGRATINTGFTPGIDDWEFVNHGSYIAAGGHCAGQSVTAMWYYYEKKLQGAQGLYHAFDSIDFSHQVLWQDNPRGYRWASVVQEDLDWSGRLRSCFVTMRKEKDYHKYGWYAFALSMLVTGEPQYVGLLSKRGGHAVIAYRMSLSEEKLYVADPNYPAQVRTIAFESDTFKPYSSRLNMSDPDSFPFYGVGYFSKTAMVDWEQIGKRYGEFEKGTIGSVGPNAFPAYTLYSMLPAKKALGDSLASAADSVVLEAACPTCEESFGSSRQHLDIFDSAGTRVARTSTGPNAGPEYGQVYLKPPTGPSRYGIAVFGLRPSPADSTRLRPYWLDFRWLHVMRIEATISPALRTVITGQPHSLTMSLSSDPAQELRYEWLFGDGSSRETVQNTSTVTHTYQTAGTFTVRCSVFSARDSVFYGSDTAVVRVSPGTPRITLLDPDTLPAGGELSIRGTNFGTQNDSSRVHVDTFTITEFITWSDSAIQVLVPSDARDSRKSVRVSTEAGRSSSKILHVTIPPPVIESIEPTRVCAESTVTIRGRLLKTTDRVEVHVNILSNGTMKSVRCGRPFAQWSDSLIVAALPVKAVSGSLWVSSGDSVGNRVAISVFHDLTDALEAEIYLSLVAIYAGDTDSSSGGRVKAPAVSGEEATMSFAYDTTTTSASSSRREMESIDVSLDFDHNRITSFQGVRRREDRYISINDTSLSGFECEGTNLTLWEVKTADNDSEIVIMFRAMGEEVCDVVTGYNDLDDHNGEQRGFSCFSGSHLSLWITRER